MTKKRWPIVLGVLAVSAMLLAGCSTTTASKPQESQGPVTLTYWDFIDPTQANPRSQALSANIANFEKANPNIKINLSVVALGDMLTRLPQAAAAGTAPDVFKMFSPVVPQMAAAGAYSPLPAAASNTKDWLHPTTNLAGPDGKQVAEPYEYRTCTLYYNQKILTKLGVAVPTTYAQVVDVAKKAAAAGYTGFGTGFSNTDNSAVIGTFFDCYMSQTGQSIYTKGQADFATKTGDGFGDLLANLRDANALGKNVVSDTYSSVADGLANGTVAMAVLGTEREVTFATTAPDVKAAPLPKASTGGTTGTTFGWTLGIGAGSKHADAAWKFIQYMTGPQAGVVMATGGEVPTRAVTYKESYFTTAAAKTINTIATYVKSNSQPRDYPNNWISLSSGLANAGQALVLNKTTGTQFISSAQAAANKK